MSKAKSGGGVTMNKNVRVPIRAGAPSANKISPAGAAAIGISKGNHADTGTIRRPPQPLVTGTAPQVPLGNAVATNVGAGGPGAGRVLHASGSQGQHGAAVPGNTPQPRDILSEFSPKGGRR